MKGVVTVDKNNEKEIKSTIINGGTGSGKNRKLNIPSNFVPRDERIIIPEDNVELDLKIDLNDDK